MPVGSNLRCRVVLQEVKEVAGGAEQVLKYVLALWLLLLVLHLAIGFSVTDLEGESATTTCCSEHDFILNRLFI